MKHKHFYSHIVEITDITIELGELDLKPEERVELLALAEANMHNAILNTVLSELSKEDKKIFMKHLIADNHKEIWTLLSKRTINIEDKIRASADNLKKDLLSDIRNINKKKTRKTRNSRKY